MYYCGDGMIDVTDINYFYLNFIDFFLKCVVDMYIGKSIKKMIKMRYSEERVGEVRRGGLESGKKKNIKKFII